MYLIMGKSKSNVRGVGNYTEKVNTLESSQIFKKHQIEVEKVSLFKDFCVNLFLHVDTTYFGPQYIKSEEDIMGHFNWAYNSTVKGFSKINFDFSRNKVLYNYFKNDYLDTFYKKNGVPGFSIKKHWERIMNYEDNKLRADLELMVQIYKIFNASLK